jgi:hypothetical protein
VAKVTQSPIAKFMTPTLKPFFVFFTFATFSFYLASMPGMHLEYIHNNFIVGLIFLVMTTLLAPFIFKSQFRGFKNAIYEFRLARRKK